jgi:hypothetical protein
MTWRPGKEMMRNRGDNRYFKLIDWLVTRWFLRVALGVKDLDKFEQAILSIPHVSGRFPFQKCGGQRPRRNIPGLSGYVNDQGAGRKEDLGVRMRGLIFREKLIETLKQFFVDKRVGLYSKWDDIQAIYKEETLFKQLEPLE